VSNAEAEVTRLQALIKDAEWASGGGYEDEPHCPWCGQYRYGYEGDEPTPCPAFGLHAAEKLSPRPVPREGPKFGLEALIDDPETIQRVLGPIDTSMLSWIRK
jgi:hypothetical protein